MYAIKDVMMGLGVLEIKMDAMYSGSKLSQIRRYIYRIALSLKRSIIHQDLIERWSKMNNDNLFNAG